MTTSANVTELCLSELAVLRAIERGDDVRADADTFAALVAKGLLDPDPARHALTPAGRHAIHVGEPGKVPGIDN